MSFDKEIIQYVNEWEAKLNAFIELKFDDRAGASADSSQDGNVQAAYNLIRGFPFAVSDNIAVKDFLFTSGSKLLEQFRSPFSATAVLKLQESGGIVIGKTNVDEFGMGCTGSSALKQTNNPWDFNRMPGSGSAAAVAAGIVPYALGIDTGGGLRQAAAFCGIPGLKPTFGAVSRLGLSAYASSLETAGIFADSISRIRAVFALMRGSDPLDQSSRDAPSAAPALYPVSDNSSKKIAVLSPQAIAGMFAPVAQDAKDRAVLEAAAQAAAPEQELCRAFELAKQRLSTQGHTLVDIEMPCLKYSVPAFYAIAAAEAASNLTRFDGIRLGARPAFAENPDELIDKSRNAGFGPEVKLQILLGTHALRESYQEKYFNKAQQIRESIKLAFESLLGGSGYTQQAQFDAILMPVYPERAFERGGRSAFAQKAADVYSCSVNLAGFPALSFPVSLEGGLPAGVQLVGRAFAEGTLLGITETYEKQFPFPNPTGYKPFWS